MTIVAVAHINIPEYAPRPLAERLHETKASYPSAIITSADRSCLDNLVSYNTNALIQLALINRKPSHSSPSFTLHFFFGLHLTEQTMHCIPGRINATQNNIFFPEIKWQLQ